MKKRSAILLLAAALLANAAVPELVSSTPAQGQSGVLPESSIRLAFSAPMDADSLTAPNAFTLYELTHDYHTSQAATVLSPDGLTVTLSFPYLPLRPATAYRLVLNPAVLRGRSGSLIAPAPPILFNTYLHPDLGGPLSAGTVPADSETGVAVNTKLYVVFDRPIANVLPDSGITVSSAAGPLKVTARIAGDRIVEISSALLFPANQRISVSVDGIIDRSGIRQPQPISFSFQTGVLPDTQNQAAKIAPIAGTPVSLPLRVVFAKPLDPPLLAAGSVVFQDESYYQASDLGYPASWVLSEDRTTLTLDNPSLPPGGYSLWISVPFDRTAGRLDTFRLSIDVGATAKRTPAALLAASPADGTADVPVSAAIRLAFTAPVDPTAPGASVILTSNGSPVSGQLVREPDGTVLTFKPRTPLQPSTTHALSASGLMDFAGNVIPPFAASFTTSASGAYPDAFKVLSIDPSDRASGVDSLAPIKITFTHPPDPVGLTRGYNSVVRDTFGSVTVDATIAGSVLTLRPRYPMGNGVVWVSLGAVTDLSGATAPPSYTSFEVKGAPADVTRPFVTAVSPGDGATVLFSGVHVELEFSEPVVGSTVTSILPNTFSTLRSIAALADGLVSLPLKATLLSSTRVMLEFTAPPDTLVTLLVTSGITDLAGNSLVPFRASVRTSRRTTSSAARLLRQTPYNQSSIDAAAARITTYWSAPLDRASVEQNLLVYSSQGAIAGRLEWTADSRAFAFIASAPLPAGGTVFLALMAPAHDAAGLAISLESSFYVSYFYPPPDPGPLAIVGSSVPYQIPSNFAIDLQFSQDLSDAFIATIKATFTRYQQEQAASLITKVSPRVLRFRPSGPLITGATYSFDFSAPPNLKWSLWFTPDDSLLSPNPAVIAAGPLGDSVAQNSGLSILFTDPVSSPGMPGGIRLTLDDVEVPLRFSWTSPQALSLEPASFLQPDSTYKVLVSGLENVAGIPFPDYSWTFTTRGGIDTDPLYLSRIQPTGSDVAADAVVSFTYSKPIAPDSVPGIHSLIYGQASPHNSPATTLGFSGDLKTIFLRPNAPLAAGATLMASLRGGVRDFAGNTVTGPLPDVTAFQVGYLPGPSPLVTGTSPRADATGVPVNSIVQIQSNANLAQFAGITATLAENGKPLNASMRMEGDGRTLTLVPSRPFAASALLEVVVTGITSDPYHFSFTTGSDPVVDAPRAEVWPINGQSAVPASVVVHIRFDQRLNPLSVNASNVTLQLAVLDGPLMDATVSLDGSQSVISLAPKLPLLAGRSYTVSWAVSALGGGTARNTSSFTVGPWDDAPAALLGIDPASGSSDASPRAVVRALFSKPVELTLGNAGFRLLLDGVAVPGQINVATGTSVLFTPLRPLQLGATYRVELSGVVDALGNALAPAVSTFTVALSDTAATALRLLSSSPVSGATGVAWDAPVRLSFNRPVTLSSALNLTVQSGLTRIPVAPRVEGNDIVFQFTAPVAGPQIVIRGVVSDTGDYATSVTLIYSLAPVADTTLPAVEYTFPAAGSTIPAFGSTMVIRFSEPVTVGQSAIRIIGASSSPEWYLAADGRTVTASPSLVPDSDIAVVVGSGVTDLTGNPLAPTSFSLHVLSADESASPRLKSVLPPAGAIGIPPDSLVQLQFTHPMDAATVNLGLHVIADGVPLTGSVAAPEDGRSFRFQPDSPFRRGALVDIRIGSPAQDTAGQLLEAFSSYFTVVKDGSAVNPSAITLSASTTAIDVGFDAPLDRISLSPCIRAGSECIPSHWELRDLAWLRVTPEVPLQPGRQYSLVLDQHTVFPLRLTTTLEEPEMESVEFEPGVVHIRFTGEINPLTINPGTLRLVGDRGAAVSYFAGIGAGRRDVLLRLQHPEPELTVVIDGPESASGVQIRRQQRRLRARPMEGSYPYR